MSLFLLQGIDVVEIAGKMGGVAWGVVIILFIMSIWSIAVMIERFFTFRRVEDIRKIMEKYGDAAKQMAVLEFGWTSDEIHPDYKWHAVTEQQKADYLVRAYQYAKKNWPYMGLMSLIYIADPDWKPENEQYWWAITNPDGSKRPAFDALKAMPK